VPGLPDLHIYGHSSNDQDNPCNLPARALQWQAGLRNLRIKEDIYLDLTFLFNDISHNS
jgi:hypothetical protein